MAVTRLPGSTEAARRLRKTALRDFSLLEEDRDGTGQQLKRPITPNELPLPVLARYALELLDIPYDGPGEKVEWSMSFTFRGRPASFALAKFGPRVWVEIRNGDEVEAREVADALVRKLAASVRTIEQLVLSPVAKQLFAIGAATVVNQHVSLRGAYRYFRERSTNPVPIEDEVKYYNDIDGLASSTTFRSGKIQMLLNQFHDLVAAVNAYLSSLEHDLVLALPFVGFDPADDVSLPQFIGLRWGDKYNQVFDITRPDDKRYYDRLIEVVERWRNTYSHGGFEKGQGGSVWLQYTGIGAIPVGLSSATQSDGIFFSLTGSESDSPGFFLRLPAKNSDVQAVFALFDEIDAWLSEQRLPEAYQWINSGLDVRFDQEFRDKAASALVDRTTFAEFVEYHQYLWQQAANMDY